MRLLEVSQLAQVMGVSLSVDKKTTRPFQQSYGQLLLRLAIHLEPPPE